jgi:hypothetical protein
MTEVSLQSRWWQPRVAVWWIAVLFMIGSFAFALGAVPAYLDAVDVKIDSATFFAGSLFFTSAAFLAWRTTPRATDRANWWANAIQFVGTLCFNVSTFHALATNLTASESDKMVWRPDAYGSVCFLVSSAIAYVVVGGRRLCWQPRCPDWWIAALNLLGSIAFGVSAVASYVVPATGDLRNAQNANAGTFVGAICFLVGAYLLLPATRRPTVEEA